MARTGTGGPPLGRRHAIQETRHANGDCGGGDFRALLVNYKIKGCNDLCGGEGRGRGTDKSLYSPLLNAEIVTQVNFAKRNVLIRDLTSQEIRTISY